MTITPLVLSTGAQLGSSAGAITNAQTSPAQVTTATFTNTDAATRLVTVYIVRASGTAGLANALVDAQPLGPGQDWTSSACSGRNLNAGDTLWAMADAGAVVNCVVDGFTIGN
jgi:hypothetical protein